MDWEVTVKFPTRPFLGNVLQLAEATSIVMREVPSAPKVPGTDTYLDRTPTACTYQPYGDPRPRHSGYVHRDLKPTGSMPTFDKPKPDGIVTQDDIDAADLEGYSAFLEGDTARMSGRPYELGSTLDRAWQNGWDRAEHSDDSDKDGV